MAGSEPGDARGNARPKNERTPWPSGGSLDPLQRRAYSGGFVGAICRIAQSVMTVSSARALMALVSSQVGSLIAGNGPTAVIGK